MPSNEEWLRTKDVTEEFHISDRTLHNWFRQGLRRTKIGGLVYVNRAWLNAFLESHEIDDDGMQDDINRLVAEVTGN